MSHQFSDVVDAVLNHRGPAGQRRELSERQLLCKKAAEQKSMLSGLCLMPGLTGRSKSNRGKTGDYSVWITQPFPARSLH